MYIYVFAISDLKKIINLYQHANAVQYISNRLGKVPLFKENSRTFHTLVTMDQHNIFSEYT